MAVQYVYVMKGLSKAYPGGKKVLNDIWLSFFPGAKIGIVGHNGSGKSTLLRIMAGQDKEFNGEAWAADGIKVGFLEQEPKLDPAKNALENVMDGLKEKQALLDRYNEIMADYSDDVADEAAKLQDAIDHAGAWDLEREAEVAMDALRCPPAEADVSKISGGEKRRIALAKLLLEKPDMLLLDEPTNHLDAESVAWLENYLRNYPGTVVMVTHDRYFLDNITGWTLELDRGEGRPFEGNYSSWLDQKSKMLYQEEKTESARAKAMKEELEWVRSSPKARQAKSKARLKAYDEMVAQQADKRSSTAQIVIPVPPRLGNVVIEAEGLKKAFGDRLLIDNLSFNLPPGGIVGIIGPNGAGKTTLFRMITGAETPDAGSFKVGETVKLGYIDQSRDALNNKNTVWEEISEGNEDIELGKVKMKSRAYCSSFNFKGSDQQKTVGMLSGGERNRVHLAKMLKTGANVLLLDEPTNDLDVETLRALEDALLDFAGCAVVISHDRWFLDRVATHILAFEGDSHVEWFEGNYADYEEDKKRRLGEAAVTPKRIRYKSLLAA
ncbi:MAG: energy-dependent translational throttle protein EttA [Alphaproteobacteria bacterium]|nr:energy-dependent translational throttle protein EttA [Alphaproteobacteria bacterium]